MKPQIQAVRFAQAWASIEESVTAEAKAAGVKVEGLDATHRDPELQQLFRMEALAAFYKGKRTPAQEPVKPAKEAPKVEAKPTGGKL